MVYRLGVDIGTTYTAAAVWRDGAAEMVGLGNRALQVPSVLYRSTEGDLLVGERAATRAAQDPERAAREFKRRIGDPVPILLAGAPFSAEALTGHLLSWVVGAVSERQGEAPASITVAHPANWSGYKIDLLRHAFRLADLPDVSVCSEPEAAAIAYASRHGIGSGLCIAAYDLGGGTFDAAVLREQKGRFAMLGEPEGIEHLGGVDFDEALFRRVLAGLDGDLLSQAIDDPDMVWAWERLRRDCVEAKEALSEDTGTTVSIALGSLRGTVRLTRSEFEETIRPALQQTLEALRRALRSAGLTASDLSTIVLVGGSSRIPLVSEMLAGEFGRPLSMDTHPKHDIALGAAMFDQIRNPVRRRLSDGAGAADGAAKSAESVEKADEEVGASNDSWTGQLIALEDLSAGPETNADAADDTVANDAGVAPAEVLVPSPHRSLGRRGWLGASAAASLLITGLVLVANQHSPHRRITADASIAPLASPTSRASPASARPTAPTFTERCSGPTCTFTLTSKAGAGAQLSWNFGDHSASSAGPRVSHTYRGPGAYHVFVTLDEYGHTTRSKLSLVSMSAAKPGVVLTADGTDRIRVRIAGAPRCRAGDFILLRRQQQGWRQIREGHLKEATSLAVGLPGLYRLDMLRSTSTRGFCAPAVSNALRIGRRSPTMPTDAPPWSPTPHPTSAPHQTTPRPTQVPSPPPRLTPTPRPTPTPKPRPTTVTPVITTSPPAPNH